MLCFTKQLRMSMLKKTLYTNLFADYLFSDAKCSRFPKEFSDVRELRTARFKKSRAIYMTSHCAVSKLKGLPFLIKLKMSYCIFKNKHLDDISTLVQHFDLISHSNSHLNIYETNIWTIFRLSKQRFLPNFT